jgi:hypothetical protein
MGSEGSEEEKGMPSDDDILAQLEEIDIGEVTGEEISLDEGLDLDFEDEGVPLKPKAAAQEAGPQGPGPKATGQETGLTGSEIRIDGPPPAKPKAAGQAKAEPGPNPKKAKATPARAEPKVAAAQFLPNDRPAPQAEHRQVHKPATEVPATASVQEMVLHAKTLRIVADTVVIEPKTVSILS